MRLRQEYSNIQSYFFVLSEKRLHINGVVIQNSVHESKQFPYSRDKTSVIVLKRLQTKFILCKINNFKTRAKVLLVKTI